MSTATKPGKGKTREQTIARMVELRTKENLGVNAIAQRLDEEGYATFGKAKKWPHRVVYGALLKKMGASKMKRKSAPSRAAQTGKDAKVSTAKTPPVSTAKLDNGDHDPLPDGIKSAQVVKLGTKDVKPDPKPTPAKKKSGTARKTSAARKTATARKTSSASKRK